jgi:hypothetical protein
MIHISLLQPSATMADCIPLFSSFLSFSVIFIPLLNDSGIWADIINSVMKWTRFLIIVILMQAIRFPSPVGAIENVDINLHLAITEMRKAGPPELLGRKILFSYKPKNPVRFVGISLDYENFTKIHPFIRNEFGVYIFTIEFPDNPKDLTYKYVIDGLWMTDPNNKNIIKDENGNKLSYFVLNDLPESQFRSPILRSNGVAEFSFRYYENRTVYVAGSFNNWDPFMHKLTEYAPGLYSIRIRLDSRVHHYYFLADGKRMPDPLNIEREVDNEGFSASRITVPQE